MLHYTWAKRLARDKHSRLLGRFRNYKDECSVYDLLFHYVMMHYNRLERLVRDKHFSLLDPFGTYEENEVLRISLFVTFMLITLC